MVTGLIYTEVDSTGYHGNEKARVKRSLVRGARFVRRMRVRNSANARTAYANERGRSLLLSIQQMEGQIHALQGQTRDYEEALQAESEARKEATEALKAESNAQKEAMEVLMKEVTILRPFKDTAVDIRERFFATYRREQKVMRTVDQDIIDSGNRRAHAGDVILDACLLQNQLIIFEDTFSDLYGITWRQAKQLLGFEQLVDAMNARATAITNRRLRWSFEQEVEFRLLVNGYIYT